jgi:pimeloyl-ACP methyl ester carboxylesterase
MRLNNFLRGIAIAVALFAIAPLPAAYAEPVTAGFKDDFADVNGIRLHYVTAGKPADKMILFVHGFFNFSGYWTDQLAEFGKDHYAVAPDMRGYNLSSRPAGVEQYKLKLLVDDLHGLNQKLNGGKKFILVGHDWGGIVAYVFAMYYPELVEKLIVSNAPHPQMFERELNESPWQRYSSHYMLRINGYGNDEGAPTLAGQTREAVAKRFETGWVADQVKLGRYSEADRQKWIDAVSTPGAFEAGANWYRANDLNPPFNDVIPASQVARSWSTKAVTQGAKALILKMPTLIVWGVDDNALPPGNLTGFDDYFTNYKIRMWGAGTHNVTQLNYQDVNKEMRDFIEGKKSPKVGVYPAPGNPRIGGSVAPVPRP